MKKYVLGFAYCPKFYLLIQKTHPEFQFGKLNGIGGAIEDGETPIGSMVREFQEEAGIITKTKQWLPIGKIIGKDFEVFVYKTYIFEDQYNPSNLKHEVVVSDMNLIKNPSEEKVYLVHEDALNYLNERGWLISNIMSMIKSNGNNNIFLES
jgi:8-oxo-dGTP pyrophosphatase MutT (NUDIX family)